MADKGFDLKVLIPTDDGITISESGIGDSLYYLTYNISDRSYQLADKFKAKEVFRSNSFNWDELKELFNQYKIDKLLVTELYSDLAIECILVEPDEIIIMLNGLIDKIDNKEL